MAKASMGLDEWRVFFRTSKSDIFSVIENGMLVAASDCPREFKLRRDRMAEILFTCKIDSDEKYESGVSAAGAKDGKESNRRDDDHREVMEKGLDENNNNINDKDCSYEDAEALEDEMELESQVQKEILRIKKVIDNSEKESEESLLDSLRRLELMPMTLETLKTTDIGKSVNALPLRKHKSNEIQNVVRSLIEDWRLLVEEWSTAAKIIEAAEEAKEPAKTSSIEKEEGLPSPPLEEVAFLANPVSMELSQKFFDGIDDDGNPQKCVELNKKQNNVRKQRPKKMEVIPKRDPNGLKKNQELVLRTKAPPSKPVSSLVGERKLVRPKPVGQLKAKNEVMVQQKSDRGMIQKKPMMPHQGEVRTKLEAAKRKLQERNHEVDKAKKQRVVEWRDLQKQSPIRRNQL